MPVLFERIYRSLGRGWGIRDAGRGDRARSLRWTWRRVGEVGLWLVWALVFAFFAYVCFEVAEGKWREVRGRGAALAILIALLGSDWLRVIVLFAAGVFVLFFVRAILRPPVMKGKVLKKLAGR